MSHERREVFYRGHVQGVGFRFRTRQISSAYAITGFVENLPDGGVHLIVEGDRNEIDQFLTEVDQRMASNIRDRRTDTQPAQGKFTAFSIRH